MDIVDQILSAKTPHQLFDISTWESQFRDWVKLVHPDKNSDSRASDAFDKLKKFKDEMDVGVTFEDELCKVTIKGNKIVFIGPPNKLQMSYDNFHRVKSSVTDISTFKYYIPEAMTLHSDRLEVKLWDDIEGQVFHTVKLTPGMLDENHAKWVLNRLLEFVVNLHLHGNLSHNGLTPESVLICPETHGIQIISFYHAVPLNANLVSAVGKLPYRNWYPTEIFTDKKSVELIDLEFAKRLVMYVLGDPSGIGTDLRGKIGSDIISFLLANHESSKDCYLDYQTILDKAPREYHSLII